VARPPQDDLKKEEYKINERLRYQKGSCLIAVFQKKSKEKLKGQQKLTHNI